METARVGGGGGGATVKVTVTVAGDPWAPEAVTVTWPVYVPAVRAPTLADIFRFCGAVPLAGVTESQTESLLALKFSVPEPVLVTLTKAGDGSDELP